MDGNWTVDTTARREPDSSGIENNVLLPIDLADEPTDMSQVTISSAAPDSTTTALAAQVPIETETNGNVDNATISSVAPDSTTAALAAEVPKEAKTPSLKGVPGGFPQTPDTESPSPAPAISTGEEEPGNPAAPVPGDSVPYDHLAEDTNGGVRLDKQSPEIVDAPNLTPTEQREVLDIAPLSSAEEADVLGIVKENQEQAHTLEDESKEEVFVAQPTTEGGDHTARSYTAEAGIGSDSSEQKDEDGAVATAIPEVVRQSQIEAHASPEAGAVESAVEAKKGVESELKQEVSPVAPVGEPAVSEFVEPAEQVPEVVLNSMSEARAEQEAAGVNEAVEAKSSVPIELNTTAEDTTAASAPKPSDNQTETGLAVPQTSSPSLSPTSLSPSAADPTKNGTLKNGAPRKSIDNGESPSTLTKKKRLSLFGALRERFRFGKDKGKSKGEKSP